MYTEIRVGKIRNLFICSFDMYNAFKLSTDSKTYTVSLDVILSLALFGCHYSLIQPNVDSS